MVRYFYAQIYSNTSLLNTRVTSLITHNNDTEGNSELIDIRTGYDRTVYDSAGNAVRGQIENLQNNIKNNISYLKHQAKINNILSATAFSNGSWSWEEQTVIPSSIRMITADGISIESDTEYNVKFYNDNFQMTLLEFDSNGNIVGNHGYTNEDYTFISKSSSVTMMAILKYYSNNSLAISAEDILNKFDIEIFANNETILSETAALSAIQSSVQQNLNELAIQQTMITNNQSYLQTMYEQLSNLLHLEYIEPVNKFNSNATEHFTRIEADGRKAEHASNSLTGFIRCRINDTLFFARTYPNSNELSPLTPVYISEYDENKNFICRNEQYATNGTTGYFDITNSDTAFIRAEVPDSAFTDYKYSVIVNYSNENVYTEYFEPYYSMNSQSVFEDNNIVTKLRIMSYNIGGFNYGSASEGGIENSSFPSALQKWKKFFGIYQPDIVGVQEFKGYIDRSYSISSVENLFGKFYPYINDWYNMEHPSWSTVAIMSKWNCTDSESLRLTDNSTQITRWALIQHITVNGQNITFVSVHRCPNATAPDYESAVEIRHQEMNQLIGRLSTEQNVIITGDFNVTSTDEYAPFINAGYSMANGGTFEYKRTFNYAQNYTETANPEADRVLDNIIVSPNIIINSVDIPEEAYNLCTSDHLPIYADVMIL